MAGDISARNELTDVGSSYVVFGTDRYNKQSNSPISPPAAVQLCHQWWKHPNRLSAANSVSSAGDVNGDGIADLIVGADITTAERKRSSNGSSLRLHRSSYVIFGSSTGAFYSGSNFSQLGTASADSITGSSTNDAIAAGAGDDIITANGGD